MSTKEIVLTAERGEGIFLPHRGRQPLFWIALLSAALVHAALIASMVRTSSGRHVGSADGSDNAIDVEIVDAKELASSGSNTPVSPPPAAPPQPQTPPTPEPVQEQAEEQPAPEPPQEQPPPEKPAEKPPEKAEEQAAAPPAAEEVLEEAPALPDLTLKPPSETPAEPKPAPKSEKTEKKQAQKKPKRKPTEKHQLDLSVPLNLAMRDAMEGVGSSGAVRPPGITRSGENDRFGRDVIRALKRTMPPSYGVRGRATVRIILDERGYVDKLQLVQSGGDRNLDADIMFAARQTAYPFPPKNSTIADRTFVVTYVYR